MRKIHQWIRVAVLQKALCIISLGILIFAVSPALAEGAGKHFLWAAGGEANTVYFLGSIHLLQKSAYPLGEAIEAAYRDSETVVFETDMEGMNDPEFQARMLMTGVYPEGQRLQEQISQGTYRSLKREMEEVGLPMEQFSRFKPWLCAMTLGVVALQQLGFDPRYGIDNHFYSRAQADGKKMDFFEPVEYQLQLFAGMDQIDQEKFLKQTLKDLEVIENMADEMVGSWKHGNAEKMNSLINMSFEGFPEIYHRLVVQRNLNWMEKIDRLMNRDGNVLVIVGAGHLVGSEGVLNLLREKGVDVQQQ